MIKRTHLCWALCGLLLLSQSWQGAAAQDTNRASTQTETAAQTDDIGERWFNRMSGALRDLNFEATLVQVHGDRIQPLLWMHGRHADGLEVELVIQLNGADVRILRLGDTTSYYFQPSDNSYSLQSDVTYGLIPAAFYQDFSQLSRDYQVLLGGGMRISGRDAQLLRLVSRDNSRYHFALWIDRETGMLLKMQMLTPSGDILEQIQLTSFSVRRELPVSLNDLRGVPRPPRLYDSSSQQVQFGLEPTWLPSGFKLKRQNNRGLYDTQLPTDYFMYGDGLTDVSIYIVPMSAQALPELALQGPESLVNVKYQDFAITVVGKMPVATLRRIAESVRRRD